MSGGERMTVSGIELEVVRRGSGPPLVFLHGMQTVPPQAAFLDRLARHASVIAPSSPGFGRSPRPADIDTVYDLVHLHLDLLDQVAAAHGDRKIVLAGHSFGGWLAAELAIKASHRLAKLILIDAFGIKVSDRETADIVDVFNTRPDAVRKLAWHDPANAPDFDALSDDEIAAHARSWEALCLYGWNPYMYNPQLKRWLKRIAVPTLVLWGEQDGIVTPAYGRAYADLIPGARFETIARAAHAPHLEQPDAFADRVVGFLER
ncbi:MAG TPA: alpha/beta hydrolase [Candidatus Sulfotelmatobacter sp.]|nr:alpha/beta hydrolase [Candidatus Sulfotelmatobacter sp.]